MSAPEKAAASGTGLQSLEGKNGISGVGSHTTGGQSREACRPAAPEQAHPPLIRRVPDAVCCVAFAALFLAFYWRYLGIGRPQLAYTYSDFSAILVPFHDFNVREWQAGRVPLWNNSILAGEPHLANLLSGVFYPFSLVELLLSGHGNVLTGIYARLFFDSTLAAVGMYLLVRRLTSSPLAGALSGVAFSLSSFLTGFGAVQMYLTEIMAWMPLCLFFLDRALVQPRFFLNAWLAGWCFGAALLAGYPQMALALSPSAAGVTVFRAFQQPKRRLACVLTASTALVAALSISAVQGLPSLEFFRLSDRWEGAGGGGGYHLSSLLGLLIPAADGDKGMYIGLVPVALSTLTLFWRRRPATTVLWWSLAALGFLLSMGENTPAYRLVFSHLGFGWFTGQARNIGLSVLSLCVLSGFGLAAWARRHRFWKWLAMGAIVASGVNLLVVNWSNNWPELYVAPTDRTPKTSALLMSDSQREPMRFDANPRILFPPDEAYTHQLESMEGDINFVLKRTADILRSSRFWRQWELFNVRFVMTDRDLKSDGLQPVAGSDGPNVYRMLYPLPRAYVVWSTRVADSPEEALGAVLDPNLKIGETAVLEKPLRKALAPPADRSQSIAVHILNPQEIQLDASAKADGFLVLSYAYYPGWKASIDGKLVSLQRANYAFEGLLLPAGQHVVRLWYEPESFRVGAAISIASVVVFVIGVIARFIQAHRRRLCIPMHQ